VIRPNILLTAALVVCAGATSSSFVAAAGQCRLPSPPASAQPNIFTPAQEAILGELISERFESYLRVIDDEPLTAVLRRIGERLTAHLPDTGLRIRMQLIDIPDANAFALPGGHVYVSRKLVGLTRSEDELAGVIGHELGHLVSRQATQSMTRQLREVLGVTSVGDRQDILDKFTKLMENAGRKPSVFKTESHEQAEQLEADRLGLTLVSSAGYDAKAFSSVFDRIAGTGGNTGSFFSRMFGTASPDSRRLGDMMKTASTLPADCISPAGSDPAAYRAWQLAVTMASIASREEKIPGLFRQVPLTPFRDRIRHVRFSPDGKYVLVQDDATVSVIQRQPFEFRFSIPSGRARSAEFTPDSATVVLHTSDLRVERWSVASKAVADVYDLYWPKSCYESAVSPDGRTVGCVDTDGDLTIIDAASGRNVFQKKNFYQVSPFELLLRAFAGMANTRTSGSLSLKFSADGRFFAAGYEGFNSSGTLAFDVSKSAVIQLKDPARRLLTASFTFISGDRLVGLNAREPAKSGVVALPEGNVVESMALPAAVLDRAAQPRFVVMRPWQAYPIALFDVEAGQPKVGFETLALDVFDDQYVTDTGIGEIGLFAVEGKRVLSRVKVDPSPITRVRTAAVSSDFRWLAISGATRAAVWDLRGQLPVAYMREFDGSFFDPGGQLYADLPRAGAEPRGIVRFDPQSRKVALASRLDPRTRAAQYGPWLLLQDTGMAIMPTSVAYELRDVSKSAPLWTRKFEREMPNDYWLHPLGDGFVFVWAADSPGGRTRVARDERLKKTVDRGDLKGDFLLEVVDAATGNPRANVLVETGKGSFHVDGVLVRGDRMFVTDSLGRVLSYSLSTGEVDGYAFGASPVVSADGGALALETGEGRLAVVDAKTMARKADFRFKHAIVFTAFGPDSASLLVVTADQTAHAITLK